ncbi:uncharacterized protein LOC110627546 [Manihot esculenta]|uniref:Late embryogenesis abundant protein LEA-2 subgroup domain-containing protein n=1 Tax=Manihot esculenta TaxID=3983 RepID=A0A2C9UVW4_MANES|nr:uncharacterized protein LOC110627546 [Manihot esculenta]OAY35273.1 hypothetical protein MANES_12G086500v8 [Manihot esculenta]
MSPPAQPSTSLNGDHRPLRPPQSSNTHHHHPYYPTSSSSKSASLKGCCCCCCLFLLFSFLALLVLAIFLIIILTVKPKKPEFDLQQVGVQYMGIPASNLNSLDPTIGTTTMTTGATTASLSLTIHMLFTAVNPNKVGIKYSESKFTVMYHGIPLGKASVPGFYQEAHSERQVEATISVDRYSLIQANAVDLIRDASLNDRVEPRVLGEVGAKIRVVDFDSPGVQVSH